MALAQTTAPSDEVITATEAKLHCRVSTNADDDLIGDLIEAAREYVEEFTRLQLVDATWTWKLDGFPHVFYLPRNPVDEITSISYIDTNGDTQTLATSVYDTDLTAKQARIVLKHNQFWPDTRSDINSVTVVFVAGYGAKAAVPKLIKAAMLLMIGHWYEHREQVVRGEQPRNIPMGVRSMLYKYRILQVSG